MKRFFLLVTFLLLIGSEVFAEQPKKVDIFVTSWCPYCRKLEGFLKQNRIDYTRYDVEQDAAAGGEFERLGGEGVPLVRVGDDVVQGYDPNKILASLVS